jgi:hypothetical protein
MAFVGAKTSKNRQSSEKPLDIVAEPVGRHTSPNCEAQFS